MHICKYVYTYIKTCMLICKCSYALSFTHIYVISLNIHVRWIRYVGGN